MIILENRSSGNGRCVFESVEQIVGSQTWLQEFPSGFGVRCHYYDGRFSLEEISINTMGILNDVSRKGKLSGDKKRDRQFIMDLKEKFNENFSGKSLSEEEVGVLFESGFLGLIGSRCPELQQNMGFILLAQLNSMIEGIDVHFNGCSANEIRMHIDEQLGLQNSDEFDLWKNFLKKFYEETFAVEGRINQISQDLKIQEIKAALMSNCKGKTINEVAEYFKTAYEEEDINIKSSVLSNIYSDPIWARDIEQGEVQSKFGVVSTGSVNLDLKGQILELQKMGIQLSVLLNTKGVHENEKKEI